MPIAYFLVFTPVVMMSPCSLACLDFEDYFEPCAPCSDLKGLLSLFKRKAMRNKRAHIHPALLDQSDAARVGMFHSTAQPQGQAFAAGGGCAKAGAIIR